MIYCQPKICLHVNIITKKARRYSHKKSDRRSLPKRDLPMRNHPSFIFLVSLISYLSVSSDLSSSSFPKFLIFQCWASDNFYGLILIWSDQIRYNAVFSFFVISDSDLIFRKKWVISDWHLIKNFKNTFLCALHRRVPIYCCDTCFLRQQNDTHTSRVSICVTYSKKTYIEHKKNVFMKK